MSDASDTALNEPLTLHVHPHPSASTAAEHPFAELDFECRPLAEMRVRANEFAAEQRTNYLEIAPRIFVLFPIGFPLDGAQVPHLHRKSLDEVRIIVGELPTSDVTPDAGTERR